MGFLEARFYDNPVLAWLIAVGVAVVSFAALRVLKAVLGRHTTALAQKVSTEMLELVGDLFGGIKIFFILAIAAYAGSLALSLPADVKYWVERAIIIAFLLQAAMWGSRILTFFISRHVKRKIEKDPGAATTVRALGFAAKLALYATILILALDNIGVNVTTLVAGLGIGGIAIALAVQNILGDLFASFSIMLDRPFVLGDFVIIGDYQGTVEHIGLKTTRIRSLSGEQIIFSNSDLLSSRIRNYKRMYERRIVLTLGVTYQTPLEKLKAVPRIIREAVETQNDARFDRAHFKGYGDFSLNFEYVYYVKKPDYNTYMDVQQAINLAVYERFAAEGIEFAYPTQTLYVNRPDSQEK